MKNLNLESNLDVQNELRKLLRSSGHYDPSLALEWATYLGIKNDQSKISEDHKSRLALCQMFEDLSQDGRTLFHLTVTYRGFEDKVYSAKIINHFFTNFYLKCFLPHLMGTRGYHEEKYRSLQPICYAFLDEHHKMRMSSSGEMVDPERLHHHAILAVTSETLQQIRSFTGDNKIPLRRRWGVKVMTTHLVECESMRLLYASKMHTTYPDYLIFPDRQSD